MGLKNKFKSYFFLDEEEGEDYYEEQPVAAKPQPLREVPTEKKMKKPTGKKLFYESKRSSSSR
ncbi:hypothetical protein PCORN_12127 [Listeria cornellensis FSL F6-0969]|uniref:Uncharacterized protein n=1 Tax=Listeria cornellensis FSL F6-0969 TaxID=1265820 RepID=W7BNH6_9LIST|nr:hypothetical protein PCORN_12127 [Listeria cornellensis FSL F6-0969]